MDLKTGKRSRLTLLELAPAELEKRLGLLMRWYISRRSTLLAMAVVRHIEALCAHPEYHGASEQRCVYRRLARQWQCLAWIESHRLGTYKQTQTYNSHPLFPD